MRAYGEIGAATAERLDAARDDASGSSSRSTSPSSSNLQVETHTFHAQLLVPLTLTAHALAGVRVYVEITPPRSSEVQVQVQADGLRASIMQRVANIEGELRRFVARYVARELTKPHIEGARMIDVAAAIDRAWAAHGPELATARGGRGPQRGPGVGDPRERGDLPRDVTRSGRPVRFARFATFGFPPRAALRGALVWTERRGWTRGEER